MTAPDAPVARSRPYDVAIIGTVGLPARYGGFETLAEQLVDRLGQRFRMLVFCTGLGTAVDRPTQHQGADLQYVEWGANGWQSIPYDIVSMWRAAPVARTLLLLGVSGCMALPLIRLMRPRVRIVAHVDGLEWQRRKWGWLARAYLRLSEWMAVRYADEVIADNQAIVEHLQRAYSAASTLIAYGGDHVVTGRPILEAQTRFPPGSYHLTICRIEPENNILEILRAFAARPGHRLVMVGNWGVSDYARDLRRAYGGYPNIELKDPIYDLARLEGLRSQARAYVHGHSAGGTNPSLVEAMTMGLAVLAFDVHYNRHTTGNQASYWIDSDALQALLGSLDDVALTGMAASMARLAAQHYTWSEVSRRYAAVLDARALPPRQPEAS
jgi:glycosyltransferase involved in cell wall biosynthesis